MKFRDAIRECDFVVTAEMPLTPGTTADDVKRIVGLFKPVVQAVQINDNASTRPHMAPLAAASLVLEAGIDPIVHLTCRDRNRIALQSDLMGAAVLGVTSLILSRGEKLPAAHKQRIKGVFDIGARRLLATAQAIGANQRLVAPPGFFLGANVTIIDPPAGWSADGIDSKATAGTRFVQTQPCLDLPILKRYMAALVSRKALERVSVIVQVPLLESMDAALEMQRARRPLLMSSGVRQRLAGPRNFAQEAEAVCIEMVQALHNVPGVDGVNIVQGGDPATVVRIVRAALQDNLGGIREKTASVT